MYYYSKTADRHFLADTQGSCFNCNSPWCIHLQWLCKAWFLHWCFERKSLSTKFCSWRMRPTRCTKSTVKEVAVQSSASWSLTIIYSGTELNECKNISVVLYSNYSMSQQEEIDWHILFYPVWQSVYMRIWMSLSKSPGKYWSRKWLNTKVILWCTIPITRF